MEYVHLSGRVPPLALEAALERDLVFADPGTVLVLRDGAAAASPARLARRGVRRLAHRLALAPEVAAETAFEEGWIDGVASREAVDRSLSEASLSAVARAAAARRMSFPSRSAALALERAEFAWLNSLPDKQEGIGAFFEKRKPRFPSR